MPQPSYALFRDERSEHSHASDRFDRRIRVIPPGLRVMAASATVIVAASLAWAIFGTVPTRVTGQGVLLAGGRAGHTVQPVVSGPVVELLAKQGDYVHANDVIARIEQISLDTQLASNEARVAALCENLVSLKEAHEADLAKSEATYRQQLAAAQEQISAGKVRADRLKEIVSAEEGLLARGLINRIEVAKTRALYDQTVLDVANSTARRTEIEAAAERKRDDLAEIERQKQADIDALQAVVVRLRAEVAIGSVVKAPISGQVVEVRVARGDFVSPGTVIATIAHVSPDGYEVVAVFSHDMSKRITPSMDVHVRPVSVKKEEYGSMRGRVSSITEHSVSKVDVDVILRNPELTSKLMADSAPLLAKIEVLVDNNTASGFAWWGGRGPPFSVTRGTRVAVDVIVERTPPIALIIPALRNLLGIEG